MRKQKNFRLTEECIDLLEKLSETYSMSQSDLIEWAVEEFDKEDERREMNRNK